jgi:hypothetical protein
MCTGEQGTRTLTLALGAVMSSIAMSGAALQRAGDPLGMAQACAVVAALHLLPVLCKSKGAQALWLVCLVLTVVDLVACGQLMGCLRAALIHLMAFVLWREELMPEPIALVDGEPKELVNMKPERGTTIH